MRWTSIVAIYFLFLIASAFIMLPFGVKTDEEVGKELIPGQARSAPHRFNLGRQLLRAPQPLRLPGAVPRRFRG